MAAPIIIIGDIAIIIIIVVLPITDTMAVIIIARVRQGQETTRGQRVQGTV